MKIKIKIPQTTYCAGEPIHGTVSILCGDTAQIVERLKIALIKEWKTNKYGWDIKKTEGTPVRGAWFFPIHQLLVEKRRDMLSTLYLGSNIELQVGQEITFPFEIIIPVIQKWSDKDKIKLEVRANIHKSKDVFSKQKIKYICQDSSKR